MTIDRAKLEKAIDLADWTLADSRYPDKLRLLTEAARAYLETLPKVKTIEVWRVEYATRDGSPGMFTFKTESAARAWLEESASLFFCTKFTGRHQQEVPC